MEIRVPYWVLGVLVLMIVAGAIALAIRSIRREARGEENPVDPNDVASHRKEAAMGQHHPPEESMYLQVAGEVGVRTLVERFYYLVVGDPLVGHRFPRDSVRMGKLRHHFAMVVGQVLGGPRFIPDEEVEDALRAAHANLPDGPITSGEYWRTLSYFFQAASSLGIPQDIAVHAFGVLWKLEDAVVPDQSDQAWLAGPESTDPARDLHEDIYPER